MRLRTNRLISNDEHLQVWRDLEARVFPPETNARETEERERVEAAISEALCVFGQEGWDFRLDHYRTPDFVCRFTLMNKALHRWEVIRAALEAFDCFRVHWVFDLGLADAIEGKTWLKDDNVGRLIVTSTEVLLDGDLGLAGIPVQLHPIVASSETGTSDPDAGASASAPGE